MSLNKNVLVCQKCKCVTFKFARLCASLSLMCIRVDEESDKRDRSQTGAMGVRLALHLCSLLTMIWVGKTFP